jgi:hypothetical protein
MKKTKNVSFFNLKHFCSCQFLPLGFATFIFLKNHKIAKNLTTINASEEAQILNP